MYRPQRVPDEQFPEKFLPLREILAERIHDAWAAKRMEEGWSCGPTLDPERQTHPSLCPYNELPESEKEYDRTTAATTLLCLIEHGYLTKEP